MPRRRRRQAVSDELTFAFSAGTLQPSFCIDGDLHSLDTPKQCCANRPHSPPWITLSRQTGPDSRTILIATLTLTVRAVGWSSG